MAGDERADDAEQLRQLASALRIRFHERVGALSDLLRLLCPPALWLGTLSASADPIAAHHNDPQWSTLPASQRSAFVRKWIQHHQTGLLDGGIVVDWADQLERDGHLDMLNAWFCPAEAGAIGAGVAMSAYGTLLAYIGQPKAHREGVRFALRMLERLVSRHLLRSAWLACGSGPSSALEWETAVRTLVSVPAKVANAIGSLSAREPRHGLEVPASLEWWPYMESLAVSFEDVVSRGGVDARSLALIVGKLARTGAFPCDHGLVASHGFWRAIIPAAQRHVRQTDAEYSRAWRAIMDALDSVELGKVIESALSSLSVAASVGDLSPESISRRIKSAAALFEIVFGPARYVAASDSLSMRVYEAVMSSLLNRGGSTETMARMVVACISTDKHDSGLGVFARARAWLVGRTSMCVIVGVDSTNPAVLTVLIVLCLARLPKQDATIRSISADRAFLDAVQAHLSSTRPHQRLLGMLVAEIVSQRSLDPASGLSPLDFGADIWAGEDAGRVDARTLRAMVDAPADADVSGWAELIVEPDAAKTVAVVPQPAIPARPAPRPNGKPKAAPKIAVLSSSTPDEDDDLVAYALPDESSDSDDEGTPAEAAIRAPGSKRPRPPVYIADLAAYLRTDSKDANLAADRIAVALRSGEALIRRKAGWGRELAENARDLAWALLSLQNNYELEAFEDLQLGCMTALVACSPSEALIEQFVANHYSIAQRFTLLSAIAAGARELAGLSSLLGSTTQGRIGAADATALDRLADDVTRTALSDARADVQQVVPDAGRERLLTVRRFASAARPSAKADAPYATMAADTFIMPLINRMWLYLRDVATSTRTVGGAPFLGAGGSSLLQPLVMARYLGTLCVLLDAARTSPHLLAVLAPESIELALALRVGSEDEETVLASALELVLLALDTSASIDAGRTLATSFPRAVNAAQAWADAVWHGAAGESRVHRAAAGILVRVDEILRRFTLVRAIADL